MRAQNILVLAVLAWLPLPGMTSGQDGLPDDYCRWEVEDYAIMEPLCGLAGDTQRGAEIERDIDTDGPRLHAPDGRCIRAVWRRRRDRSVHVWVET